MDDAPGPGGPDRPGQPDGPDRLDYGPLVVRLVESDVLRERADGRLVIRPGFERTYSVCRDTHLGTDDETFRDAIADAFWLDREEAAARIEETGVTRAELAAFEALRSYLDEEPDVVDLASMAALVVEANPPSPVPEALAELDDETYEPYLDAHPDAVVFVWKRDCTPCEAMKRDLDAILDRVGDRDAAGIDGELSGGFREEFSLTAAPSVLYFRGGDVAERADGRQRPEDVADALDRVYGDGE